MKKRIRISEALTLLEQNYPDIQTIAEWADEMGYSRSYFCRRLTKEFGLSPKEFRLRLIKKEIQKTRKPLARKLPGITGLPVKRHLTNFCLLTLTVV